MLKSMHMEDWSSVHQGVGCPSYPGAWWHIWLIFFGTRDAHRHIDWMHIGTSTHLTRCTSAHWLLMGCTSARDDRCVHRTLHHTHPCTGACGEHTDTKLFWCRCVHHTCCAWVRVWHTRLPGYHAHTTPGYTEEFAAFGWLFTFGKQLECICIFQIISFVHRFLT